MSYVNQRCANVDNKAGSFSPFSPKKSPTQKEKQPKYFTRTSWLLWVRQVRDIYVSVEVEVSWYMVMRDVHLSTCQVYDYQSHHHISSSILLLLF